MASKKFGIDIEMLNENELINLRVDTVDVTLVTAVGNNKRLVFWNGFYYYSNNVVWVLLSAGGYNTIEDEGVALTQRSTVDFKGAGVVVTDNGVKTIVTVSGGGGSSVGSDIYLSNNFI